MSLWPHQEGAISATMLAITGGEKSGLIVLPTGTGKTRMVMTLGQRLGVPMLFLVHRDELVTQTLRAAAVAWPQAYAVGIQAGARNWDRPNAEHRRHPDLAVAMVQTLANRLDRIAPDRFGIVVADEAHLSIAPTWDRCLSHFQAGFTLGVTATPERLDGKPLALRYGKEPLYTYPLRQAIEDGRLAQLRIEAVLTRIDLDQVESAGGDFRVKQLSKEVNTPQRNELIARSYERLAQGRRAVAFCVDVAHAEDLTDVLRSKGLRCQSITGATDKQERPRILAAFARGELDILTSCEVLTTGFDDPGISCVIMARPTQSKALYIQCLGRGLRLAPGKLDCIVIDLTDNCRKHKLIAASDLTGKPERDQGELDLADEASGERETEEGIEGNIVSWRFEEVCPWPDLPSLDGYVPTARWHNDEATVKQIRALKRKGLEACETLSKGEAQYLLHKAAEYEAAYPEPATEKQRFRLQMEGLWQPGMSKKQANQLITRLKQQEQQAG